MGCNCGSRTTTSSSTVTASAPTRWQYTSPDGRTVITYPTQAEAQAAADATGGTVTQV
ncbi:DUF7196 family protein [Bailinhaonella thermotolerans]|uniref:DUF7196 family protein n=1 Tax=Bailinhaonella thermotolerans TaxID=1070861 RepID=UPI00192A3386|nr:hypothetical protein [Bailinhaonella thermotolerans]